MRWWGLVFPVIALGGSPDFRVERFEVAGGSEILTVFDTTADTPLLSVLRDKLGDANPENDRLRYVWVLTSTRPSVLQHAAASLPFFYWRPDFGKNADHQPVPVIDLGSTSRDIWRALAGSAAQVLALDSNGALIRSSTRSYRNNVGDRRRLHLLQGLAVLSQLADVPEAKTLLSESDLLEIEARLTLAQQPFGGLVASKRLPDAYLNQRAKAQEMRGQNWELLRQRAEANGLYFQPLGVNGSSTHALLWIAKEDLGAHRYDSQFLGIADPYKDQRLRNWAGYTEIRDGHEMIPLALYGLEYPKVPLLLVDFRDARAPKRREMARHAATDVVSGVLGISKFGNWPYLAGSLGWNILRVRHGAPYDRTARLNAYSQVRTLLVLDQSLNAGLKTEMQKRLEILGVNPLADNVFEETWIARRQYAALIKYAEDPRGLPARIERDRNAEMTAYRHSWGERAGFRWASIATLGIYRHHERTTEPLELALDRERRVDRQMRFLETVSQSSPQLEVVWNMDEVRHALDEITASGIPARSARLVERILSQTKDEETRMLCQRALQSLDAAGGQ